LQDEVEVFELLDGQADFFAQVFECLLNMIVMRSADLALT
jgi:hypothetical protein